MTLSAAGLVSGSITLVSLPEVYQRVNEMINVPHYSAQDIGAVIAQDPALTVRLLKLVNSAFYGFPHEIDTVARAITIIGLQDLRDLILATSVTRLFNGLPNSLVTMESFWRHSIAVGLFTRALAMERHLPHAERYFVAGLLHDIGRLLLFHKLPELSREALSRATYSHQVLHRAEQEVIGFDHAEVGAELLRAWRLPASLEEAVTFHHEPRKATHVPLDAALVHIADLIANALMFGTSGSHHVPPLDPEAWERVGLPPEALHNLVATVEIQYEATVRSILKMA